MESIRLRFRGGVKVAGRLSAGLLLAGVWLGTAGCDGARWKNPGTNDTDIGPGTNNALYGGGKTPIAPPRPPIEPPIIVDPPADSLRVRQGTPPLNFMLGAGGPIRINNVSTGRQVYRGTVGPMTLVRVDAAQGVVVGQDVVKNGPLGASDEFEIFLDRSAP